MMSKINFVNIIGYSNYRVSPCAKILNVMSGRILKNNTLKSGYQIVRLTDDEGKVKPLYVHHLVGKAFIQPLSNNLEIDHINRDKTNNSLENLRYLTRTENCLNQGPSKNRKYKGVLKQGNRYRVRMNGKHIGSFKTEREAAIAYNNAASAYSKYCYLNIIE